MTSDKHETKILIGTKRHNELGPKQIFMDQALMAMTMTWNGLE